MNTTNSITDSAIQLSSLRTHWLTEEEYKTIQGLTVIPTVDFIVRSGRGFMLIKRGPNNRWPNIRWFFGGGQKRGETEEQALKRLAKSEAGITLDERSSVHFVGNHDCYNPASTPDQKNQFPACHTKMAIYIIDVRDDFVPILDSRSSDPQWFHNDVDQTTLNDQLVAVLKKVKLIP